MGRACVKVRREEHDAPGYGCASCDIVPSCSVMETSPDLLTSPEVSQLLRVSIRTVHRRVEAGDLRALRKLPGPNGAYLFVRADVDAYVKAAARTDGCTHGGDSHDEDTAAEPPGRAPAARAS